MPVLLLLVTVVLLVVGGWFLGTIIMKRRARFIVEGGKVTSSLRGQISELEERREELARRQKELERRERKDHAIFWKKADGRDEVGRSPKKERVGHCGRRIGPREVAKTENGREPGRENKNSGHCGDNENVDKRSAEIGRAHV